MDRINDMERLQTVSLRAQYKVFRGNQKVKEWGLLSQSPPQPPEIRREAQSSLSLTDFITHRYKSEADII